MYSFVIPIQTGVLFGFISFLFNLCNTNPEKVNILPVCLPSPDYVVEVAMKAWHDFRTRHYEFTLKNVVFLF
jgi:hypothetical protein